MSVTIYTKNHCVQCDATKRALKKNNIDYTEINMDENAEALEHVKSLGFAQAPVIVTENDSWSGFRPDKIATL